MSFSTAVFREFVIESAATETERISMELEPMDVEQRFLVFLNSPRCKNGRRRGRRRSVRRRRPTSRPITALAVRVAGGERQATGAGST